MAVTPVSAVTRAGADADADTGETDREPVFHLFLLFGQSNMYGYADNIEPQDRGEDPRVKVLGFDDCDATGRVYNEWDIAAPPLHAYWVNGIGIGDYFGKTIVDAYPEGDSVGLIPCAIPGAGIDLFGKDAVAANRGDFFLKRKASAHVIVFVTLKSRKKVGYVICALVGSWAIAKSVKSRPRCGTSRGYAEWIKIQCRM